MGTLRDEGDLDSFSDDEEESDDGGDENDRQREMEEGRLGGLGTRSRSRKDSNPWDDADDEVLSSRGSGDVTPRPKALNVDESSSGQGVAGATGQSLFGLGADSGDEDDDQVDARAGGP